jgi:hypothetical protein
LVPQEKKVGWVKRSEPTDVIARNRAMETHFHGSSLPAEALAQAGVPSGHGASVWFGILKPFTFDL